MPTTTEMLTPDTTVGHANPQLADWEGTVMPTLRGSKHYARKFGTTLHVRVAWHAGTGGTGHALPSEPQWVEAGALTLAGVCPDCGRPTHYIFPGNPYDRSEGWHHDHQIDLGTCWAGKAAFEASRRPQLDGCSCGEIGGSGSHYASCAWSA